MEYSGWVAMGLTLLMCCKEKKTLEVIDLFVQNEQ